MLCGLLLLASALAFTALRSQPSPILDVSPPPNAADVWLGSPIRVTFAVPMDRTSVETRFQIDPPLTGTFTWQVDSRGGESLEFQPKKILTPTTPCRVTLQAGIRDAAGRVVLNTDYTWTFTIGPAFDAIQSGQGLPVQLVDPTGRNRVRLWTGYPRMRVHFALYALPVPEFAARYGQLDPWGNRPIDVSGLTQVAAWQQDFGDTGSASLPGPSGGGNTEIREAVLPSVPSGVYVLVASHPYAGQDEVYVVVSRHVLALKQGATRADREPPEVGRGNIRFAMVPEVPAVSVGRAVRVDVWLQEATADLGGFGLVLRFDPARLRVAEVPLDPALADRLALGPHIDNQAGRVAFGVLGELPVLAPGSHLATITFVGKRVGEATFTMASTEAVDAEMGTLEADAAATAQVVLREAIRFLPLLRLEGSAWPPHHRASDELAQRFPRAERGRWECLR